MSSDSARRLIFLVLSICVSMFSWTATATTFDPLLLGPPQMIVVDVSVHAPDKFLTALVPGTVLRTELVEYASSRFRDEGLDVQVTEHYQKPPQGVLAQNVVRVWVRVELALTEVRSQATIVGAVSIHIRRDTETAWAPRPFTFFAAESENKVTALAGKAAIDQLELSIIEPIVSLAK